MILRIEMLNEPGVKGGTLELVNCWMILCNYEGIDKPNERSVLWQLYELE